MKYDFGQHWETEKSGQDIWLRYEDGRVRGFHVSQAGENVPGKVLPFSGSRTLEVRRRFTLV